VRRLRRKTLFSPCTFSYYDASALFPPVESPPAQSVSYTTVVGAMDLSLSAVFFPDVTECFAGLFFPFSVGMERYRVLAPCRVQHIFFPDLRSFFFDVFLFFSFSTSASVEIDPRPLRF